jgi:hypothetical protein
VAAVNRSKRRHLHVFLMLIIKDSKPGFIKKKMIRRLPSSTLYHSRLDIPLVWVTAWLIRVLVLPKLLLITLSILDSFYLINVAYGKDQTDNTNVTNLIRLGLFWSTASSRIPDSLFYLAMEAETTFETVCILNTPTTRRHSRWPIGVALVWRYPLLEFAGSNPAEAVGFFLCKNPRPAFLRRGS